MTRTIPTILVLPRASQSSLDRSWSVRAFRVAAIRRAQGPADAGLWLATCAGNVRQSLPPSLCHHGTARPARRDASKRAKAPPEQRRDPQVAFWDQTCAKLIETSSIGQKFISSASAPIGSQT